MYFDGTGDITSQNNSFSREQQPEEKSIIESGSIKFNFPHINYEECITMDYRAIFHACPSLQMLGIGGTVNFCVSQIKIKFISITK
jgi:hypothetical protein